MDTTHVVQSLLVAVGLSAATGFRVFLPALIAAVAARAGVLPLSESFQWLASVPAIVTLSLAALFELGAYTIPWLDHALDVIATPAAILAGFLLSAAVLVDMDPLLRWSLAVIVGAGAAALVQVPTATARGVSTWTTGGLANPLIAGIEAVGATLLSILTVLAPFILLGVLVLLFVLWLSRPSRARAAVARAEPTSR